MDLPISFVLLVCVWQVSEICWCVCVCVWHVSEPDAPGREIPVAQKWLKNRRVILHSDSARSYRSKVDGMLHDAVVHKKRRVKKGNKWVWVKPVYVKISTHKLPDGTVIKTKRGTQIIDRAWRFIKDRLRLNQHGKASSKQLAAQIRSAQYEYWHRNEDLWVCTGQLLDEYMRSIVTKPEC